jgi:regulator of sigma E protease
MFPLLWVTVKRNKAVVTLPSVQFPNLTEAGMTYSTVDFYVQPARKTVVSTVKYAFYQCVSLTESVWHSLAGIVTGKIGVSQLSGPVGTGKVIGEAAAAGLYSFLMLFIFISINLGIMNLLPFPALDGGRILMLFIEKLRGKPLNQKFEGALNFIGFSLLMLLMLAVTFQDFFKLFTK